MWIKNSSGKKDAMLTFAAISFLVTTLNILLSTVGSISVGSFDISFNALDASIMSTYLGIAFSAYVGRKWTDKKYPEDDQVTMAEQFSTYEKTIKEEPKAEDTEEIIVHTKTSKSVVPPDVV